MKSKTEIDMCLTCKRLSCDSGNCLRMMQLRRREVKQLYLAGQRVTQRELARLCHVAQSKISDRVKQGWTGDQIVERYGGTK